MNDVSELTQSSVRDLCDNARLKAHTPEQLAGLDVVQALLLQTPQVPLATEHVFHGGLYARTIRVPADTVLSGALIKVATLLVLQGVADVWRADGWYRVEGYNVLAGAAGRKQLLIARSECAMTMVFPTRAMTVDAAEREFTDEFELLMSHGSASDTVLVTGE